MALFPGGRADGNRGDGAEPKKIRSVVRAIDLTAQEQALVVSLANASMTNYVLRPFFKGKENMRPHKSTTAEQERVNGHFHLLPKEKKVAVDINKAFAFEVENKILGLKIIESVGEDLSRVEIAPDLALDFLNSEPVKKLLQKIRDYDKSLPHDDSGDKNKRKLAGICSDVRGDIVDIRNYMENLSKELTIAARGGNLSHPEITTHEPGGRS